MILQVTVNEKYFELALEDTDVARAFSNLLPIELDMRDVNGNEKFCLLDDVLPGQPVKLCQVQVGQLMLYQNKGLVMFYKDVIPCYKYCKIGELVDKNGFEEAIKDHQVSICFEEKK